jgi:hypothetical protein
MPQALEAGDHLLVTLAGRHGRGVGCHHQIIRPIVYIFRVYSVAFRCPKSSSRNLVLQQATTYELSRTNQIMPGEMVAQQSIGNGGCQNGVFKMQNKSGFFVSVPGKVFVGKFGSRPEACEAVSWPYVLPRASRFSAQPLTLSPFFVVQLYTALCLPAIHRQGACTQDLPNILRQAEQTPELIIHSSMHYIRVLQTTHHVLAISATKTEANSATR